MKKLIQLLAFLTLAVTCSAQVQNMQAASGATGDLTKPSGGFNLASGQVLNVKTGATVSGAGTYDFSSGTSFIVPNGAAPTTTSFGWLAGDNNAWGSNRGTLQFFDGTANVYVLASLASSTPTNGQIPQWNTGGTITWVTPSTGVSGANPTASIGLSAVNGSATTYLRSDGAPALAVNIVPTWTGVHTFTPQVVLTGGASLPGGGAITGASGAVTLTASNTNANVNIDPIGTGISSVSKDQVDTDNASFRTWQGGAATGLGYYVQRAGGNSGFFSLSVGASQQPRYEAYIASGSYGSLTATDSTSTMSFDMRTYGGSTWVSTTGLTFRTTQTQSESARGSKVTLATTPNTTTAAQSVMTWDQDGSVKATVPTGGLGYGTGAGGTVTQATSKSTGVTLRHVCGQITMNNAALAALTAVSFTLTNTNIATTDVVVVNIASGGTVGDYMVTVNSVGSGSCQITVYNITAATPLSEALVLNFAVIKAVSS